MAIMKAFYQSRPSLCFIASVALHLVILGAFSLPNYEEKDRMDLMKLPNAISLNLSGVGGNGKSIKKAAAPKTIAATSTQAGPAIQKSSPQEVGGASSEVGTGTAGSKNGVAGGTGDQEATFLSAKQKYLIEFRGLIEGRKEYPLMARKRGLEGTVVIGVTIKKNGEVIDHKIVQESGHKLLDQAALSMVMKVDSFKAFPAELGSNDIELKFPIAFKLNG